MTSTDSFFREVFDYVTSVFPHLATQNPAVIHAWSKEGYELATHIRPAVDFVRIKGIRPSGFTYFTRIIENNRLTYNNPRNAPTETAAIPINEAEKQQQTEWIAAHGIGEREKRVISPEDRAKTLAFLDARKKT
jgi:hypothetical protein